VLREIAWRLREIGNDSRICDLIDAQVAVIERASDEVTTDEAKASLGAAFAAIGGRLAEFGDIAPAPATVAAAAIGTPEMPAAAIAEAAETAIVETAVVQEAPEPVTASFAEPMAAETTEAALTETSLAETSLAEASVAEPRASLAETTAAMADAEAALAQVETLEATDVIEPDATDEAAVAEDEAILDIIAMEMGAPDPIDDEAIVEQAHFAEPAPIEQVVAEAPEPVAAVAELPVAMPAQPAVEAAAPPALEMSLGSSILASGMLGKTAKPANDPLAPIRRMSQVEKIAFFS